MPNVDYNNLLYEKVAKELADFIAELKTKSPDEMIESAYELTIKEDMVSVFEGTDYSQTEAKALYKEKYPLDACYQEWLHNDLTHMDIIKETVEDKIRSCVKRMKAKEHDSR